MKIRLQISAGDHCSTFEHVGPTVRIGRDPAGELVLEGEACTSVSRAHSCIDLKPEGAMLTDGGSSNGTLVNDRLISGTVALAVGDRIGLGYTGPKLSVVELDLLAVPIERPLRLASWVIWAVATAVIALVISLIAICWKPATSGSNGEAHPNGTHPTPAVSPAYSVNQKSQPDPAPAQSK